MKFFLISILFFSFLVKAKRFEPDISDPFEKAVYDKKIELVRQKIKEGVDTDRLNSALKWVGNNKIEIIKLLIENGADVNTRDEGGKMPLHFANKVEMAKLLIDNGADVNTRDEGGKMPLHFANKVEMAKLLIDNGADVNTRDEGGNTPLHFANKVEMAKLLIDNGADVNAMSNKGQTPCDTAFKGSIGGCDAIKDHLYSKIEYKKVRHFIIKQGGTGGKECKYDYFRTFKATMLKLLIKTFCHGKNACGPIAPC